MEPDADFIGHISGDVLKLLGGRRFFDFLDDRLCPDVHQQKPCPCVGDYTQTTLVLAGMGFDHQDISEILQVLASQGGCCDCEILFNVAANSRLKSEYWRSRAGAISDSLRHSGKS
jgi:hypothetical protein